MDLEAPVTTERTTGDRWFYHPTQHEYGHPDEFNLAFESVFFSSMNRRLHGWFFPAVGRAKGTIIHCHGNGGNITGHFKHIAWMPALGWNVLTFDYQGFGRSEGRPTRAGTLADTNAAIDFARMHANVNPNRLLLFGQSLGGAVAIVAASCQPGLCGVAIEGAFSSYQAAAHFVCKQTWLLWGLAPISRMLVGPGYDPIDHVARIAPTPILFITGTADRVCDHRQTIELHDAAREPKSLWVIQEGGHTTALTDTNGEGQRRLDAFFTGCLPGDQRNR
ncbi:MAG: alpha/beta hydrolase [Planctomycetes bacterium]|nr:alpha/beta hydrolase [Planctomycetota bacterium]